MKPSECSKCKALYQRDEMAQIKMKAEAMRIVEETATRYIDKRYKDEHRDELHESPLSPAPKRTIIKPKDNGGKSNAKG